MRSPERQSRITKTRDMIVSNGWTYKDVMRTFKVSEVTARKYIKAALDKLPSSKPSAGARRDGLDHTDAYAEGFEAGQRSAVPATAPIEEHTKAVLRAIESLRVSLLGERGDPTVSQRDVPVDVVRYMLDAVMRACSLPGVAKLCPSISLGALRRYQQRGGGYLPHVEFEELERAYTLVRWRELGLDELDLEEIDGVQSRARRERLDEAAEEQRA